MFSRAVSVGISWNDWKTNPTFSPRSRARASSSSAPEILAVQPDVPRGRPVEAGEQPQQRGLAAARGPHDRHEPARLYLEADILQNCELAPAREVSATERFTA